MVLRLLSYHTQQGSAIKRRLKVQIQSIKTSEKHGLQGMAQAKII